MGDITPKPKQPAPEPNDPNPLQDSALGEAPGDSIVMPDIAGWNAEASEPTPPPKGYFPPVDLIDAWRRASGPPPPPPGQAVPEGQSVPVEDDQAASAPSFPVSNRLLVVLTMLGVLVVAGLGGSYFLFFNKGDSPRPVAVTTPRATPTYKPTPKPSFRPSPRPVTSPAAPPTANSAPPGQKTYTVVAGDTLITIGERFNVDWHQIAAANGQISDPNFITPGQVLKIP